MISVCMASYNGEKYIEEQINSILKQLCDNDELIISDDGSNDKTISIVKNFHDQRVRLVHHGGSNKVIDNFEYALRLAQGNLIFLADQDDIWEKEKIGIMSSYLHKFDLVVSDCSIINSTGQEMFNSFFELRRPGKGFLKNIFKNSYMGCCMAFRKSILAKALPFPANIPMHDWWIGLVAEMFGTSFFCPDILVRYRRHEDNQTPFLGPHRRKYISPLTFRINLLKALFQLYIKKNGVLYE